MRIVVLSYEMKIKHPYDINFNPCDIFIEIPNTDLTLNMHEQLERQGLKMPESLDGKKFLLTWHIPEISHGDPPDMILPLPTLFIQIREVSLYFRFFN